MLGLGLAASCAPAIFQPAQEWQKIYNIVPPGTEGLQPFLKPPLAAAPAMGGASMPAIPPVPETQELVNQYSARSKAAFEVLRKQLEAFRPDALLVLGADKGEMFSHIHMPMFYMFIGKEATGVMGVPELPETLKQPIKIPCHSKLANELVVGLVKKGFEISFGEGFNPQGGRKDSISHAVTAAVTTLTPQLNVPIIPMLVNAYFPPLPPAQRCYNLGVALGEVLSEMPERVAVMASGGLSNDPLGRWVDEPLDRWVLGAITKGKVGELKDLFTFDSHSHRAGTNEIRSWITVGAACGRPATLVDYIPARQAKTGLAFAYWPIQAK
jgi:hypothetical protein